MMRSLALLSIFALVSPARAADSLKLAITGPFTGGSAPMGASMRDGAKLAIAEINAAGGIQTAAGKLKIEAIERDDEAKNERGAQIAQELINKEKVVAVGGYINTGVGLASERFFQDAKIPVMNNVATGLMPLSASAFSRSARPSWP